MGFSTTAATEVVFETMEETIGAEEQQKFPIATIMLVFQGIRNFFRYLRYGNVYTNSDNFLQLFSGHLLNLTLGDNRYVQVAAQCVLIANRILESIEQQRKVYRCYDKLVSHVHKRFPRCEEFHSQELQGASSTSISPSSRIKFHSHMHEAKVFVSQLIYRIYRLAVEVFKLCLVLCDTVDSFSLSPTTRNEAVSHLFVNMVQQLNYLVENVELLQKLQAERYIIDKVFMKMGSPYRTEQLITALEPLVRTAGAANRCVESIRTAANGAFLQFVQEGIFGFMAVIGLSDLLPDSWIPPLLLPPQASGQQGRVYGRYPPIDQLIARNSRPRIQTMHHRPPPRSVSSVYQEVLSASARL